MKELFSVVTVAEAKGIITKQIPYFQPGFEDVALLDAFNRRIAVDVLAPEDLPLFSRSTVDGYAVRARDTFGVTENMPGFLNVTGEIEMGKAAEGEVRFGQAVWIPTGGMLPSGADAVVMVEYTEDVGGGLITVHRPVTVGENVIAKGEDCAKGSVVLPENCRLRPAELGLLAGLGITRVRVFAKPKVGIISTGDEIIPPSESPQPGEVRDINTYALAAQVMECGGVPVCYDIVKDVKSNLSQILARALSETDMVIISGGSSVGTRDITAEALDKAEPGILFHGIAIKPGKPTIGAMIGQKPVFGLPGHPASAMVVFYTLIKPLLEWGSYQRAEIKAPVPVQAELSQSLSSGPGREDYIRVKLLPQGTNLSAVPVLGKSGLVSTLVEADGMIQIPLAQEGLKGGSKVMVHKI